MAGYGYGISVSGSRTPVVAGVAPISPSLLLHFDGSNNGTTFTDSSLNNFTASLSGSPITSTTQIKFGSASGYFNGSSLIYFSDNSAFNLSSTDFCIECWVYPLSLSADKSFIITRDEYGESFSYGILLTNTTIEVRWAGDAEFLTANYSLSLNSWQHIAVTNSGGTLRIFVNGNEKTNQPSVVITDSPSYLYIGATSGSFIGEESLFLNGYIDELRIVKNNAIYTANFTPPSSPFPNP
jgi:hypothetical protein